MPRDFAVTLGGKVGDEWEGAVGTRRFYVRTAIPVPVELEGLGERDVFFLDTEATPDEVIGRIADYLANRSGEARDAVLVDIMTRGLPIRVDQCAVLSLGNLQRWF